ncbi:hypothetical protein [Sphaerochaeta sp.]|uniref:hypothetical protein n=1 Tax=Sphaerochaeta sp. TaxID=1972642 RepID=UPI002FCC302B
MKRLVRLCSVLLFLVVFLSSVGAAVHTSVPLDHRVYRILEDAEIRGLIGKQMEVRPYSADKVLSLLNEIASKPELQSKAEHQEVLSLIDQLTQFYGSNSSPWKDVLNTGYIRTYDADKQMGTSLGANFSSQFTYSAVQNEYDARNKVLAFLKGDLGPNISYNMDFGINVDNLNSHVFLPTEFTIPGEGFYMQLLRGGSQLRVIPSYDFYTGLSLSPELAASFFDGALHMRWGSVKRDWGPGLNNLLLSGSARSFNGIDIQVDFSSWLHYSVITGSLGKFSLHDIDGKPFFSDDFNNDKPYYRFDNNFSAHRVELDATKNLTLSIYESTVWQKRFELGYLNPLAIYMFEQNNLGDIDDVLAGLDFSYTVPSIARFYGSVAMTEMNVANPKYWFTAPRNIMAFQAGVIIPIPVGTFSSVTLQWTYLSPFFYAHYPIMEHSATLETPSTTDSVVSAQGNTYTYTEDGSDKSITYKAAKGSDTEVIPLSGSQDTWYSSDGRIKIEQVYNSYNIYETTAETAYVNKGENLGYPLDPNSQEFLLQLDLGLPKGWTTQLQAKYQVRSGQYGFSIEQYMNYSQDDEYGPKSFWDNTFKHTLSVLLSATKKFADLPIELTGSYRFVSVWERPIITSTYDGRDTDFGLWQEPSFDHIVQIGAKIYL